MEGASRLITSPVNSPTLAITSPASASHARRLAAIAFSAASNRLLTHSSYVRPFLYGRCASLHWLEGAIDDQRRAEPDAAESESQIQVHLLGVASSKDLDKARSIHITLDGLHVHHDPGSLE